jgi:hypothetical protein
MDSVGSQMQTALGLVTGTAWARIADGSKFIPSNSSQGPVELVIQSASD